MDDSFTSLIDTAESLLVLLPVKPHFDQVAAGLALYLSLRDKKEMAISCPSPMLVEFNRLVGVNKVTSELGDKNLVIKFVSHDARQVERVSADIENNEFYITIVPKPGTSTPKKEQVQLSYAGVSADAVFLVGGLNDAHFPAISSKDLLGAKLVHIGTRELSTIKKEIISFARPASSVSEVITTLIKESKLVLDNDIATNLIAGIEEGSKRFQGDDVSAETFQLVADLIRAGGKRVPKGRPSVAIPAREFVQPDRGIKKPKDTPKEWLGPKIYKGTTVS